MFRTLAAAFVTAFLATSANAALVATISGVAGSGSVTWTFSGSTTASGPGFFDDDDALGESDTWNNVGDFTNLANTGFSVPTGTASLTIDGVTRAIDFVYVDNDGLGGAPLDEWGVGVDGTDNFAFLLGSEISWTGSVTVSGLDITDLSETALPAVFTTSTFGENDDTLAGELRIVGAATVVPLPAGLPLLAAGLGGMALLRRRRG